MEGLILQIRSFSVHDGPGIRQTIFLKGCPLRCPWCHNPESQHSGEESIKSSRKLNEEIFTRIETVGRKMSIGEVMACIEEDVLFYEESGGGVTISGGEPLMQPDFTAVLLRACNLKGIHTALDTCGYADPEVIDKVLPLTDLFLYDLKLADDEEHKHFTGVSNVPVLKNLEKISRSGKPLIIRIPLIAGITDTEHNLNTLYSIIRSTPGIRRVDLLPFHPNAKNKYSRLGKENFLATETPYDMARAHEIKEIFKDSATIVSIGG